MIEAMEMHKFRIGSDNFCYLFVDGKNGLVVDPGHDASEVLGRIDEIGATLRFILATHHHGDHTLSMKDIARRTGARTVASKYCAKQIGGADIIVSDGDVIEMGASRFEIITTPGHTPGCICLVTEDHLITGDTLFIDDCGRCDLPGGSLETMFASLQKLKELSDDLQVLPGHDYGRIPTDSLGNQKRTNPTLTAKDLREFSGV